MVGDEKKKLLMAWSGPFKIVKKVNRINYVIDKNDPEKLFHVNLLKKYYRRIEKDSEEMLAGNDETGLNVVHTCVVDMNSDSNSPEDESELTCIHDPFYSESHQAVSKTLSTNQKLELEKLDEI